MEPRIEVAILKETVAQNRREREAFERLFQTQEKLGPGIY